MIGCRSVTIMYYVEITPLLQALLIVILATALGQALRETGPRGRLALLAFLFVCVSANPSSGRHVRAIQRELHGGDEHQIRERVVYHNLLLCSAAAIDQRLVSVGWLGRLLVVAPAQVIRAGPRQWTHR